MEYTFGADPELFITHKKKINPRFANSAFGLIPGDKKNPHKIPFGAIQVDGMAVEYNIDPVVDEASWVKNNQEVIKHLKARLPNHNLLAAPTMHFSGKTMKIQPKEALELGCDPDFNAWTGRVNEAPADPGSMRSAGGHIHIGWCKDVDPESPEHFEACRMLVKQLDFSLFPLSLLWDKDVKRRAIYGKLGAFRPKPYGVEYRTLSNSWVADEARMRFVFRCVETAVKDLENGISYFHRFDDARRGFWTKWISDPTSPIRVIRAELGRHWSGSQRSHFDAAQRYFANRDNLKEGRFL